MRRSSLKNDNRGASLLAVMILLVVVSAIAVVITKITIVNIQMKEVERGTKKNFYSADAVMDDLRTGARQQAETVLEDVYVDVLQNYLKYTGSGQNAQEVFRQKYMQGLESYFGDSAAAKTTTNNAQGAVAYCVSNYDTDKVKSCILDATEQACFVAAADPKYEADYDAGVFTLKNIQVVYKDAQDYETKITTNLVFSTPNMNFAGQSQVPEFMKYALIADEQIRINAAGVGIDGNAYAGAGGVKATSGGSGTLTGKNIVTRGDIEAESGSNLTVGNGNSAIWAENIRTTGRGASKLVINGNAYVADDLALNGMQSDVKLKGSYYGYNFKKNYVTGDDSMSTDADFSSAIMINGRDCKLDLTDLNYLMLAGRTFISRKADTDNKDNKNSDILMGESLAARTNQLAYYVPSEYVDASDLNHIKFKAQQNGEAYDGCAQYARKLNITKETLLSFLSTEKPLVPYYYSEGVNYYLNFKSQNDANQYFSTYYDNNASKAGGLAGSYLDQDALIINNKLIMTLAGDIMYRNDSEELLKEKAVTIQPDNWKSSSGVLWNLSSNIAVRYKSLELGLTESGQGVTEDNIRFIDSSSGHEVINKRMDPVFDRLIDRDALVQEIEAHKDPLSPDMTVYQPNPNWDVYLIENTGIYVLPTSITKGIVVATGNVKVSGQFEGLLISGGEVSFDSGAQVKENKLFVSNLFAEDQKQAAPSFSQFFKGYTASATANISGGLDMESYIGYDNWKKN